MLYGFAIIIVLMVGVAEVLEYGLVTGILYGFGIDNWGILLETIILNCAWVAAVLGRD